MAGPRLGLDPSCHVLMPQPATWGRLLARALMEGRDMFLRWRLGARLSTG
ncbi:hypothetical protein DFAR_740005 [Desulfarculales bacterium]